MNFDDFELIDRSQYEPRIYFDPRDLGDDPSNHRWRACWVSNDAESVFGIDLVAYPVVKLTPAGAWLDLHACYDGRGWLLSGARRWMRNDSNASWAKMTKVAAIHSLCVRLSRWALHLHKENKRFASAVEVLPKIDPGRLTQARYAAEVFETGRLW